MDSQTHWQAIYGTKNADAVSWFTPRLSLSLELIQKSGILKDDPLIDMGTGASTLPDDLLSLGFSKITALDISARALEVSKKRLGTRASRIEWVVGDIALAELPHGYYALWHDRAVFHFLMTADERERYKQSLYGSLRTGGYALIATFSQEGPEKCSGLEVVRYSPETLAKELGAEFKLIENAAELHQTPFGTRQPFTYCLFQKE